MNIRYFERFALSYRFMFHFMCKFIGCSKFKFHNINGNKIGLLTAFYEQTESSKNKYLIIESRKLNFLMKEIRM